MKRSPFFPNNIRSSLHKNGLRFWPLCIQRDGAPSPLLCAPAAPLPDKPLDGSGSRSDWMGSAGDFSREAAPTCSHAQLSTQNAARSARGSSIPDLRLVSAPTRVRKSPNRLRAAEAPVDFSPKRSPAVLFPLRAKVGPDSAQRSAFPQHQDSPRSLVPVLFYSPLPWHLKAATGREEGGDDGLGWVVGGGGSGRWKSTPLSIH